MKKCCRCERQIGQYRWDRNEDHVKWTKKENGKTYYTCIDCYESGHETGSQVSGVHRRITGSKRRFGVEIETSYSHGYCAFAKAMGFGAYLDGSCGDMEFPSPILQGDRGARPPAA